MSNATASRWTHWNDRLKIIALGLTLGIAARWVTRTWQASAASAPQPAAEANDSSAKSQR
ncbi:hypothetical protein NA78x_004025 [Anatilimnocola sp. NA78]|uniref:hypothetical protein n=1 Tax=Anatilimnocola sp. NA78 TaxID=3415683 RepID=UPI003CE49ECE